MEKQEPIPFALPFLEQEEIDEVVETLKSGWITTGKKCNQFEGLLADYIGCKEVVAVSSCTAALHLSLLGLGVGPGDEVITSAMTFAATVNTIIHVGATPIIVDIDASTGNIDLDQVEAKLTKRTKAIVPVHFAGLPCDIGRLTEISSKYGVKIIEDSAHAIGSEFGGKKIGHDSLASCYSFYPIKTMTTIEGGAVATNSSEFAKNIRCYALHGMSKDAWNRYETKAPWHYDIVVPGYKYNMTDVQASIGLHQVKKLDRFIEIRSRYAAMYRELLSDLDGITFPVESEGSKHSYHLFVIHLEREDRISRDEFIEKLAELGVGTSVNFIPIPSHSYYSSELGLSIEDYPNSQKFFQGAVSIPLYPKMSENEVVRVAESIRTILHS